MPGLSIIIPVYNGEQTIVRCLDSIYALEWNDYGFEVIVVDDCSTDKTLVILSDYLSTHSNLQVLHQAENHRQGAARNRGIKIAKGDYIAFVDSDDMVGIGIVKAVTMAQLLDLDMVAMQHGFVSKIEKKTYTETLQYTENETFSGIAFQEKNKYWCSAPWGYLYRKNFLQSVAYPFAEDVLYEDTDFVMNHLYQANRMAYCPECSYWAFYNSQSTVHSVSYKHIADYLSLGVRQLVFYQRMESKESPFAQSILEGGVWNVNKACKHLWRLKSWEDVREFYYRIDAKCYREYLKQYMFDTFKLTPFSRITINHKYLVEITAFMFLPIIRVLHR